MGIIEQAQPIISMVQERFASLPPETISLLLVIGAFIVFVWKIKTVATFIEKNSTMVIVIALLIAAGIFFGWLV